jgi:hypothetical protein
VTALAVGVAFFVGINLLFWGVFHVMERAYSRHLDRQLSKYRHPSNSRTYPTSNVKVVA